jgi:predicted metal-binding transcription factor (methanogenesis marker protein 9)
MLDYNACKSSMVRKNNISTPAPTRDLIIYPSTIIRGNNYTRMKTKLSSNTVDLLGFVDHRTMKSHNSFGLSSVPIPSYGDNSPNRWANVDSAIVIRQKL